MKITINQTEMYPHYSASLPDGEDYPHFGNEDVEVSEGDWEIIRSMQDTSDDFQAMLAGMLVDAEEERRKREKEKGEGQLRRNGLGTTKRGDRPLQKKR